MKESLGCLHVHIVKFWEEEKKIQILFEKGWLKRKYGGVLNCLGHFLSLREGFGREGVGDRNFSFGDIFNLLKTSNRRNLRNAQRLRS